jgi:hypothetical protein
MKVKSRASRMAGWAVCAWLLAGAGAGAAVVSPLYVGNVEPVRDEYGRLMRDCNLTGGAMERSLVEVRTTTDGIVRPPTTNGVPHPFNPLLYPDSVCGMGANAAEPDSGVFCLVLSNRPAAGTRIFVRAYNAPTRAEASFYADTPLVTVPEAKASLTVAFGAAKPLDANDDDGDGLNNSWERSLGTWDRHTDDYDGDGMSDLYEMWAGTDPTDAGSLLAFRAIRRDDSGLAPQGAGEGGGVHSVRVRWQSAPGRRYQVEYLPALLGEQVYVPVGDVVTADEDEHEIELLVEVPPETTAGSFRVRLVRE